MEGNDSCVYFEQVCMNFECLSADVLNYDCDTQTKCHGHGVRLHPICVCMMILFISL